MKLAMKQVMKIVTPSKRVCSNLEEIATEHFIVSCDACIYFHSCFYDFFIIVAKGLIKNGQNLKTD